MNNAAVLTVTQINTYLESKLSEDRILSNVLVSGEISNFRDRGHLYFNLKDQENSISAVMFSGMASRLRFIPADGMRVFVSASVQVYKKNGYCQLKVSDMQPDGLGAVYLAINQLRERLAREGLFAEEHKKAVPKMPEKIGVVMAPDSDALRDVQRIVNERFPLAEITVFPAFVQGANAPASLCGAIERADQRGLDLIICGRGGGSQEDLMAFNDESVVRRIYACNTPVISAVGHEADFTLADLAADLRASTPSNAAEKAVPDKNDLFRQLAAMEKTLESRFIARLDARAHALDIFLKRIEAASPMGKISSASEKLSGFEKRLGDLYNMKLNNGSAAISEKASLLDERYKMVLQRAEAKISENAAKLDSLSPLKTLSRGYSLVYKEERLVSSVNSLSAGDEVEIRLADGKVSAEIK